MKHLLAALPYACLSLTATGQPPPGYYDAAAGLTGEPLRQALWDIISPHTVLPNSALWEAFESTDSRPDNTVWDIYSDVPGGTPPYVYQFVEDQCGTYNSEGDCFNREHTFPQSWYNDAAPMSTDLFHLYPTDAWVNQQRGNWPFGTVTQADWTSQNGGKRGNCTWPGCSGTVFEPIDAYKGDLARGYFYMLTRYLPDLNGWPAPILSQGELLPWTESLLLAWHAQDPVSAKEVDRNNAVYALQGNRNPYIDQPEWVASIWGPTAGLDESVVDAPRVWAYEGVLVIERLTAGPVQLHVFDATGRLVMEHRSDAMRTTLTLPDAAGCYAVRVEEDGRNTVIRVVR